MNILVTGCAGFIGSNLTQRLLNQNHNVIGLDNFDPFYPREMKELNIKPFLSSRNFKLYESDITDPECFLNIKEEIDCVIHLAAKAGVRPSIEFPLEYTRCNITGTQNLLEWMVKKVISKYIFASSSSVYGENLNVPFSESQDVSKTISPYAFSKKSCEVLNYTYHHLYGIDTINLRFFTVYGPAQRPDLAIRKFAGLIVSDKPLTVYGDGSTSRDYTYIGDILDGIISSLRLVTGNTGLFETINLGSSSPITLMKLIDVLSGALGKKPDIIFEKAQPGDVSRTYADISRAAELLGYNPQTPFEAGIKKFVEWMKDLKRTH